MSKFITIKTAESPTELNQILDLQYKNHVNNLTADQKSKNGFVTVRHNIELLTRMNNAAKQIIAKDGEQVVGYALVMLQEIKAFIPILDPMFEMFNRLSFQGKNLSDYSYYVMGQICIDEQYRGQGIFEKMYQKHKEVYADKFELCLTEVSVNNIPSMKAHLKVGFQIIHNFQDQTDDWNILLWNWQ